MGRGIKNQQIREEIKKLYLVRKVEDKKENFSKGIRYTRSEKFLTYREIAEKLEISHHWVFLLIREMVASGELLDRNKLEYFNAKPDTE
jgi:DNA invertase Pin-like site-specific DNA recombinase